MSLSLISNFCSVVAMHKWCFQHHLALYDVLHRQAIHSSCVSECYMLGSDNVCCLVCNCETESLVMLPK